jgi:RNA recognition motif-containing protein
MRFPKDGCASAGLTTVVMRAWKARKEFFMNKKIYVGNLSFSTTEDELRDLFATYGQVETAAIVNDRMSGQSRGFGFVEMSTPEEAQAAISVLNGRELGGRQLKVNEATGTTGGPGGRQGGGYNRDRY